MIDKIKSKAEDVFFDIVLALPERFIPMNFMEKYLKKREKELKNQHIKIQWNIVDLKKKIKKLREF